MKKLLSILLISTLTLSTSVFANSANEGVIELNTKQIDGKVYVEVTKENLNALKSLCAELEQLLNISQPTKNAGGENEKMIQIDVRDDKQKFIDVVTKFYEYHNFLDSEEYKYTQEQMDDYVYNKMIPLENELNEINSIDHSSNLYGYFLMMIDTSRRWGVSVKEFKAQDKANFERWEDLFKVEYENYLKTPN